MTLGRGWLWCGCADQASRRMSCSTLTAEGDTRNHGTDVTRIAFLEVSAK